MMFKLFITSFGLALIVTAHQAGAPAQIGGEQPALQIADENRPPQRPYVQVAAENKPPQRPYVQVAAENKPPQRPYVQVAAENKPPQRPYVQIDSAVELNA